MKFNDIRKTGISPAGIKSVQYNEYWGDERTLEEPVVKKSGFFFRKTTITKVLRIKNVIEQYTLTLTMSDETVYYLNYQEKDAMQTDLNKINKSI